MKKLLLLLTLGLGVMLASCGGESESAMRARLEAQLKDSLAQAGQAAPASNSNEVAIVTETQGHHLKKKNRQIDYSSNGHAKIESFKEIVSSRRLTEDDIAGMSDDELCLLRNLIFAIHDYEFSQPRFLNFFRAYDWYTPKIKDPKVVRRNFSSIESFNADFINKHED
ncbi:MAG: YARHG domain-containing protein [Muribaculaceae bacterium]|nr:YARHG domain-containing protein [Muribaculaceae bacterium]